MKLDRLKFAKLVAFIGNIVSRQNIDSTDVDILDEMIDIEVLTQPLNVANCGDVDHLMMLMVEGTRKIEAIKAYRVLTGAGLKESKDAVEKYWVTPVKPDTRVDSMLKKIDEQMSEPRNDVDYVLDVNGNNSLSAIKDFIKSFVY